MIKKIAYLGSVVFLLTLTGCLKDGKDSSSAKTAAEQIINGFSMAQTTAGKNDWTLKADIARIFEEEKKIQLGAFTVNFFEAGVQQSVLTAGEGYMQTDSYDLMCDGGCLLKNVKGETLETKKLYYKSDVKRIFSDDPVVLKRKGETINGLGMEATPDMETIIIKNQKVVME